MEIKELFDKPKIIAIIGNPDEAKSNLAFHFINELKNSFEFNLFHFGLRNFEEGNKINSIKELEQIKSSIIFLDEFNSLFNLEDRKQKSIIENTLRLIFHNNNILILIGTGENFKKFISGKVDVFIYKKIFYDDLINGSKAKNILMDFQDTDNIKGSSVLNLDKSQALVFDGNYKIMNIPYLKNYDSKKNNEILLKEKCEKSVRKNIRKNVI